MHLLSVSVCQKIEKMNKSLVPNCICEQLCFMIPYLSLPESDMETCKVVLTFEYVDEILWRDHSKETSLAVLSHGNIYI